MTENGWQAIGRIARERRERLGLKQDELTQYGGPGVSTVGKFERAAQTSFPLRTQHQMEKALGWSRTIVEQVVTSIDDGALTADDWEHDLVEENIPDMSRPLPVDDGLAEHMETLGSVLRLIEEEQRPAAVRAALVGMLPHLSIAGASELGRGLRLAYPPNGGDGDADDAPGGAAQKTDFDHDLYIDEAAYPMDEDDKE